MWEFANNTKRPLLLSWCSELSAKSMFWVSGLLCVDIYWMLFGRTALHERLCCLCCRCRASGISMDMSDWITCRNMSHVTCRITSQQKNVWLEKVADFSSVTSCCFGPELTPTRAVSWTSYFTLSLDFKGPIKVWNWSGKTVTSSLNEEVLI